MYFCIWKSPLIILLFLGYISVAGGKVLLDITVHICILSMCMHSFCFRCCAAGNEVYKHDFHECTYVCMMYSSIPT